MFALLQSLPLCFLIHCWYAVVVALVRLVLSLPWTVYLTRVKLMVRWTSLILPVTWGLREWTWSRHRLVML